MTMKECVNETMGAPTARTVHSNSGRHWFSVSHGHTRKLSERAIEEIVDGLIQGMPRHKVADYFRHKRSMFNTSDYVVTAYDFPRIPAAILMAKWYMTELRESFLNLETFLITERHHRTPLARKLLSELFGKIKQIDGVFPDLITMKTFTPRSYNIMNVFARANIPGVRMYPRIDAVEQDQDLMRTATGIAHRLAPGLEFDAECGIIRGGAGMIADDFWPSFPNTRIDAINDYFANNMTVQDRMLCILSVPFAESKKSILKMLGIV